MLSMGLSNFVLPDRCNTLTGFGFVCVCWISKYLLTAICFPPNSINTANWAGSFHFVVYLRAKLLKISKLLAKVSQSLYLSTTKCSKRLLICIITCKIEEMRNSLSLSLFFAAHVIWIQVYRCIMHVRKGINKSLSENEREREREGEIWEPRDRPLFTTSAQAIDIWYTQTHNFADNKNCYAKQGKMIYPYLTMKAKFMLPSSICTIARSHVTFSVSPFTLFWIHFSSPCWFEKCVLHTMCACVCVYNVPSNDKLFG